jgi:hypothetical protein
MEDADRVVVARQIGRAPRAFRRVVVRCPYGLPAVTEQWPFDAGGRPFPTTYYLTCRHLVAAVARLEAAGGVERWSRLATEDRARAASLQHATEKQRQVRRSLARAGGGSAGEASLDLGIGGSARPERLKCLHAHVAFALANDEYELGRRVLAEIESPWPADGCCSSEAPGASR